MLKNLNLRLLKKNSNIFLPVKTKTKIMQEK